MIGVAFYKGGGFFGTLIKWFTWSDYSHMDFVDLSTMTAIGALATKGVVERPLPDNAELLVYPEAPLEILDWARSQIGKGYDYRGIAGFIPRTKKWEQDGKYFCSEFVGKGFYLHGYPLLNVQDNELCTLTPKDYRRSPLLTQPPESIKGLLQVGI